MLNTLKLKLPAKPLVIGFSGGIDSTTLLTWLAERHSAPLIAAHFNHGWRGAESDDDENFCRDFCAARGIKFIARRMAQSEKAGKVKNREQSARDARLQFFAEICAEQNYHGVVLAQHRDDQVETIFLRLQRGAGWRGLRGMQPQTVLRIDDFSLRVFRPLLETSRRQIVELAAEKKIPWREDSSNHDLSLTRNFLRQRVFPAVELLFPDYRESLLEIATVANAKIRTYKQISTRKIRHEWNGYFLSRDTPKNAIENLADFITVWLTLFHAENLLPALRRSSFSDLQKLWNGEVQKINLPKNWRLRNERDGWFTFQNPATWQPKTITQLPAVLLTNFFTLMLRAATVSEHEAVARGTIPERGKKNVAYFCAALPLTIRPACDGEAFLPFGANSERKITDLLNAGKIPERKNLPLITDPHGSVWLASVRLAKRVAVNSESADNFPFIIRAEYQESHASEITTS